MYHLLTGVPRRFPHSVGGFREGARRRLPRMIFDYVDGGAGVERTVAANRDAFDSYRLVPRVLAGVGERNLETTLAGRRLAMPIVLGPTGLSGIVHPDGERGGIRAARQSGLLAVLSTGSTYAIEEVVEAHGDTPWFQLYAMKDHDQFLSMVDRAERAGVSGLCLTVDAVAPGRRVRDLENGFTVPPRLTARNALSVLTHPRWAYGVARHRRVVINNYEDITRPRITEFVAVATRNAAKSVSRLDPTVRWTELEWLRGRWSGPLAIKGLVHPDDARRAADLGVEVIVVGNHGGRQLDGGIGALEALPGVVDAVGHDVEIVLDGGVRTGADVIKAICLGARACMLGRPWLFGLAHGGTRGVVAVLDVLRAEIDCTLGLLGCSSIDGLDRSYVRHVDEIRTRAAATPLGAG